MNNYKLSTTIRVDEIIWEKFKIIAKEENRSLNSQVEFLIKKCIQEYEQQNGTIKIDSDDVLTKD